MINRIANKNIIPTSPNIMYGTIHMIIERNIQKNAQINVESVL